jgi:serine/threonine protein kinase
VFGIHTDDGKADIWSLGITLLELCEGSPPHFNVHPMRAIFIISSRAAPTLKEPERWSSDMRDFVSKCLVKDFDQRAAAAELIQHPWIHKMVKDITSNGYGLPVLEELVNSNWDAMERIRSSKMKGNATEEANNDEDNNSGDGKENKITTLRRTASFGIPATRQQMRNASLKRSTYSNLDEGEGDSSTLVMNKINSKAANLPQADGTLKRVDGGNRKPSPHSRLSEDKDESQIGTIKRSNNPNYNENINNGSIIKVGSMTRLSDVDSKDPAAGKPDFQAALRYFRNEPLPDPPESKSIQKANKDGRASKLSEQLHHTMADNSSKAAIQTEAAILDELAVSGENSMQHETLKKVKSQSMCMYILFRIKPRSSPCRLVDGWLSAFRKS